MSPTSRAALPRAAAAVLLSLLVVAIAGVAPAHASHLKGAAIDAEISAAGQLTGTANMVAANSGSCAPEDLHSELGTLSYSVDNGSSWTTFSAASEEIAACTPGTVTTSGTFSVSVASAPDGPVLVKVDGCCRVSGIQNSTSSGIDAIARVIKEAGVVRRSPKITSQPSLGIPTGGAYAQQLAATTQSGQAPTFRRLQGHDAGDADTYKADGPNANIVTISSSGLVEIPGSTTAGLTVGHTYAYVVRVVDEFGQYSERDLLLTASNNNPPVFGPGAPTGVVDVTAGETKTLSFTASDPDGGQSVSLVVGGVPSWGAKTVIGSTAEVTVTPPASAIGTQTQIAVDATDSDITAPMTAARTVTVRVVAPAEPPAPLPTTTPTLPPAAPKAAPGRGQISVGSQLTLQSGNFTVGCVVRGVLITRCVVDVYADIPVRTAKLMKIGTGKVVTDKATHNAAIKLRLNKTGRAMVNRLGGLKVRLQMTATPKDGGPVLKADGRSRLLPRQVNVAPASGVFADGRAELTREGAGWVRRVAARMNGVKSVRCTGHTSRSSASVPEANRALGLQRAKTVCRALRKAGVKATTSARTAGQHDPRVSNRTAAGQAMNRRVELTVTYRR